jgi:quercetin dioxygenase-like cupin family protein
MKSGQEGFIAYDWITGALSSSMLAWSGSRNVRANVGIEGTDATHFGYVYSGQVSLLHAGHAWHIHAGHYFCVPGSFELVEADGAGVVMRRDGWRGLFSIGGPVERKGRLRYIDRCSDTTVIQPVRRGDPCLNLLYFPPGVVQTAHTHPSDRLGVVLSGAGTCIARNGGVDRRFDLIPGMVFCIPAEGRHHFATDQGDEMRVIAWHPDSDCGPTDDDHAMINRTIVDGVSARELRSIRTTGSDTLEVRP